MSTGNIKKDKIRAAMDIGTNSTRLLIIENKKILHQGVTITRIGEGLKEYKEIQEEPLKRTIKALKKYKETLSKFQVKDYKLVATSALRDALNKSEVVERIKAETGFLVEIITGEKEAELSYLGAVADFPGKNVIIDIGGGSTEVVFPRDESGEKVGELIYTTTNLGGVRLKEDPELLKEISQLFYKKIPADQDFTGFKLIGVGGTITTIASIKLALEEYDWEKIHGLILTIEEIKEIKEKLEALSLEERKKVPGLEPERADIIVYGIKILIKFMEQYDLKTIRASDKDLLFALLCK